MSKQSNDQDEQQKPSGAAQGGAESTAPGDEADKGGVAAKGRSRRRGKGGQSAASSSSASAASEGGAAAKPGSTAAAGDKTPAGKPASASDDKAAAGDKTPAGKPASESDDKAAADDKTPAGKPASASDDKAAATAGSSDKPTPAAEKAKPAGKSAASEAPKPAAAGGGGGAAAATASGGGQGRGGGKAGWLALVLVVVLAVAVALFGWQAWQKLDTQQQRLAELESRSAADLAALENRLEEGESERDAALESALSELQGEFASYRSEVDDTLDQVLAELASEQETDERDWLHAEAAYLLRLANQRLQLERDVMGAAALLRTADERLREADNPALVPVRREIAAELAALDAVPRVDRTGLWLALNAQQEQIAGQPLGQDIEEQVARSGLEEAPSGAWQQQLSRFGQELKSLVTVRHHDQALEALITPEQESYLRQSVRLVLEQAQLALLKEEQALYEASLDKALALINGYYDTQASGVQSVASRLEALKGEAIRPELPDISGSQQALASFIQRRFESRGSDARGDDA
ncbi:uroporphyrinogen-III C-methyltransferase [Halomonas sp. C05BenzN]|uniref:uroporphyrinogen-III C-methyltransferase n=1 Tax=Halomonas sp. C05BenzN TaxID=3411041 RepID=UPI003B95D118